MKIILSVMTRKLIFTAIFGFCSFFIGSLQAQDCIPDTLTEPGITPLELPFGEIDKTYSETISVLLFPDTVVVQNNNPVSVNIDSMVMLDVIGLPTGLSYRCKDDNPTFLPLTPSCMSVFGTPTESGVFPLYIPIQTYGKVLKFVPINQADTISDYILTVLGGSTNLHKIDRTELNIFPNPTLQHVYVVTSEVPVLYNAKGQIMELVWTKSKGTYCANLIGLTSGIYSIVAEGKSSRLIKN